MQRNKRGAGLMAGLTSFWLGQRDPIAPGVTRLSGVRLSACLMLLMGPQLAGCDKGATPARYPLAADLARHPHAASFVGPGEAWREPAVLEGGTRVTMGDIALDAIAVEGREGVPPGMVIMQSAAEEGSDDARIWITLPTSFEECAHVEVELIEIEGLEGSGVLMTQLLCDRPTIPAERLSSTSLIRLDPAKHSAGLLWQGEGWSLNDRDLCLSYEVYSFRASVDAQRVEVMLDREVVATPRPGVAISCEAEAFAQASVEVIELVAPGPAPTGSDSKAVSAGDETAESD